MLSIKVKSSSLVIVIACSFVAATMLMSSVEAKPFDLYEDLTDNKFYDGVLDFLDNIDAEEDTLIRNSRMEPAERCKLPVRKGVCRALIPRWSYDPEKKECREFKFGGCDGNGNNFLTLKQCATTCQGL